MQDEKLRTKLEAAQERRDHYLAQEVERGQEPRPEPAVPEVVEEQVPEVDKDGIPEIGSEDEDSSSVAPPPKRARVESEAEDPDAEVSPQADAMQSPDDPATVQVEETLEEESVAEGTFRVKPAFDEDLQAFQKDMDAIKKKIDSAQSSEARKLGMDPKALKCERSKQHGFCFRVTLKDERSLRKHQGIIIVDSAKSGIKFRSATLDRLNSEHEALMQSYIQQQEVVLTEVMEIASGFARSLLRVGRKMAELDGWVSFATASASAPTPYIRPTLNDQGILKLEEARHPCLERKNMNYIPNGVDMAKQAKTFFIITGPNLGKFRKAKGNQ